MESEQSDGSSLDNKNNLITSTIKIELERVIEVPACLPALSVDNNDSILVNVVDANQDMETVTSDSRSDTGVVTQEQFHVEKSQSVVEVPVIETRYFSAIGNKDPGNSGETSKSVDKPSVQVSSEVEFIKPLEPYSVNIAYAKNGDLSNVSSTINNTLTYNDVKCGTVELYAPDTGPRIYNVKGNIVSQPIITKNLPEAFKELPVHGKAESNAVLNDFFEQKIREFIGFGINDVEFKKLHKYMDGDYLRTGHEFTTEYSVPSQGPLTVNLKSNPPGTSQGQNLCIVKKLQLRLKKDTRNHYARKLKYRGLRLLPLSLGADDEIKESNATSTDGSDDGCLEPGRDLIFRARMYRPHSYGSKNYRDQKPTRHSVFNNDLVMLGRQRLTALRDRIACPNDVGLRVDVSENPDYCTDQTAKQLFPSGFLFINNVFYVDRRPGCADRSAGVREWARRRGLGDFPVLDMAAVRLDQIALRLGHPEVYMHQGDCEHVFTFSEVRLLAAGEPARAALYPRFTQISQNQSVYCTTCAEFGARWLVVGCVRVPFDPAFFCDTCFRFYLYDDRGRKIGDFRAYAYRGNTVNFMKPFVGRPAVGSGEESD